MNEIYNDIKLRLNIDFNEDDIHVFDEGKTDAYVFSIKDEYLIKSSTKQELDVFKEFFSDNKSDYFQKLYYINYELSYVCLSFLKGNKFNEVNDVDYLINTFYEITSNYKPFNYEGFGYLYDDHKRWSEFLRDEVDYSTKMIEGEPIDINPVYKAIKVIDKYNIDQYLIHGDFGTHNFIMNENKLYVIDPMGVVGDPLYDFYFAIFSDSDIYTKVDFNDLLKYFDKSIEYKMNLMIILFYIRLCRTYKYDKPTYPIYVEYFNKLTKE